MGKAYDESTKQAALKLALTSNKTGREIAEQYGISVSTLRRWIAQTKKQSSSDNISPTPPPAKSKHIKGRNTKSGSAVNPVSKPKRTKTNITIDVDAKLGRKRRSFHGTGKILATPIEHDMRVNYTQANEQQSRYRSPKYRAICAFLGLSFLFIGLSAMQLRHPLISSSWLWPETEAALLQDIQDQIDERRTPLVASDKIERLARYVPLSPLPYELQFAKNQKSVEAKTLATTKVAALADAAIIRDKRKVTPRLIKFQYLVSVADWDNALKEISVLYRVWPEGRRDVIVTLRQLMDENLDARAAIMQSLQNEKPPWGHMLASDLPLDKLNLAKVRDLIQAYPQLHSQYIEQLARQRDYKSAYLTWLAINGVEKRDEIVFPIDGNFDGSVAPRPFNWNVDRSQAELDQRGGLYISYSGREQRMLAWQTIALTRGAYKISTSWEGRFNARAGDLEWQVSCLNNNSMIARLPFYPTLKDQSKLELDFQVPNGECAFLKLELRGVPGEYPQPIRATVDFVDIQPIKELDG